MSSAIAPHADACASAPLAARSGADRPGRHRRPEPGTAFGASLRRELQLLGRCLITPAQALDGANGCGTSAQPRRPRAHRTPSARGPPAPRDPSRRAFIRVGRIVAGRPDRGHHVAVVEPDGPGARRLAAVRRCLLTPSALARGVRRAAAPAGSMAGRRCRSGEGASAAGDLADYREMARSAGIN